MPSPALYGQPVLPSRLRRDVDATSSTYTSATGIDLKGEREEGGGECEREQGMGKTKIGGERE